jgi:molecular chaperone DnaJ
MSDIFEDLFGDFMGGGGGQRTSQRGRGGGAARGADLRYNMEISLTEAYSGKTAQIRVPTSVSCETCKGSGAKPGSSPKTCTTCKGAGAVRSQSGFFTVERACPTCQGRGQVISDPCGSCGGQGRVTKERNLSVNIPQGVEDGTRIRLANEGEAGLRGGPTGDLYIFLTVRPHEFFQRDGADLFCKVPISMAVASLGGEIEVPTIDGKKARVTIAEGAQTGKQFRLKSKGMPVLRSSQAGDMYIQVNVETPVNLSRRQRELLKEFSEEARNNSPESEGFFAKAKAFWDGFGN